MVREAAVWEEVAVEVVEAGFMLDPLVWVSAWDSSEPSFCKAWVSPATLRCALCWGCITNVSCPPLRGAEVSCEVSCPPLRGAEVSCDVV